MLKNTNAKTHRSVRTAAAAFAAVATGVALFGCAELALAQTSAAPTTPPVPAAMPAPAAPASMPPAPPPPASVATPPSTAPSAPAPAPTNTPPPPPVNAAPPPANMPPPPPQQAPQQMPPQMMMPPQAMPVQPPASELYKSGRNVTLPAQLSVSGVAAMVNGEKITNQELVQSFIRNGGQPTLTELITKTELEQAAQKAHITVTPAEVSARLEETKKQFTQRYMGQTWSQVLASKGLSEDYARDQTRLELLVEKLALSKQPPYTLAGKIRIYHLLVATVALPTNRTPKSDADAKKEVQQIRDDIEAHKMTFQQAAEKFSDDKSTAVKGGDLGWVSQSDPLDADFKTAAFKLAQGEVSPPVKSQYGWHLIYLTQMGSNATPAQIKAAGAESMEERARPFVQQYVSQLQQTAVVQDLLIPLPPKPASPFGMMPQGPGGVRRGPNTMPRMIMPPTPVKPQPGTGTTTAPPAPPM